MFPKAQDVIDMYSKTDVPDIPIDVVLILSI